MTSVVRRRQWPLAVAMVIGIGLALAPVAFQMFTRAPHGGTMIKGFRPYMNVRTIDDFRHDLSVIDAAQRQTSRSVASPETAARYPSVAAFDGQWRGIDNDMSSMLTTMQRNIGNYRGVAALPPFALFPWFFVIPGVLLAGLAGSALRARRRGATATRRRVAIAVLGLGLIAAPAVFQMFGRAPGGETMIDGFRPFMTQAKVEQIQGYFLTIGAAEGQARLQLLPTVDRSNASEFSAVRALDAQWPHIAATMAPMIGAMSDNVGNFQGVSALPPFGLFPWFFVIPGVLAIALAAATGRRPDGAAVWPAEPAGVAVTDERVTS